MLEKAEKIIGLIFSEEMLKKAKKKIYDKRVAFHKTDTTKEWNVENNIADLITCNLVLEHISNIDFVFGQAHKKLRNKLLFFISELHPFKQYRGSKARYEIEKGIQELETIIQHNQGKNPEDFDYTFNLNYGKEYTTDHPVDSAIREIVDEETKNVPVKPRNFNQNTHHQ